MKGVPTDRAAQDAWVAASTSTDQVVIRLTAVAKARGETPGECVDIGCELHLTHKTGAEHNAALERLVAEERRMAVGVTTSKDDVVRGATFSDDRLYRYSLTRTWDAVGTMLVVIGLNPSTADDQIDDPTIRRCMNYARDWGHGGLVMLNLFAFRATDPLNMKAAKDPVGPGNDEVLLRLTEGRTVLVAWGVHGRYLSRDLKVVRLLRGVDQKAPRELVCLGTNNDWSPRHPLYLKRDLKPEPFGLRGAR